MKNKNVIKFEINTLSNLFIGGAPIPFEIGGIDQQTAVDWKGFPYIPGSSFKGALRDIVREDKSEDAEMILELFKEYIKKEQERNAEFIQEHVKKKDASERKEILDRIEKRYEKVNKDVSAEYFFGIEGFNNTPRLLFNDLHLSGKYSDKKSCFSVDMKNKIEFKEDKPESNPRTYKTARKGLTFEGEIQLYKIELLGEDAVKLCREYVIYNLKKFNDGIYRLGNSKSRGYGRIEVIVEDESGE